ncbi:MAG TPA: acetylxylan esterase, partial [Gemmataceae bacterium]|nr:acetylxylan esterase [Gemmataceae bacterium]
MRGVSVPLALLGLIAVAVPLPAQEKVPVEALLRHPIIGPHQALAETQAYLEARLPPMPPVTSAAAWEKEAQRMQKDMLDRVVFRGEAMRWRDTPLKVEWQETIPGGPGYRIKKLRYEALPGFWVPALLYEPEKLTGKVPVVLNVNGHDANGKAAAYKQIRCINLAKRGMLALNVDWLNMGQLRAPGYDHGRMNQMDLCGTSGLAPFYLDMRRGLDLLLSLEHADPSRVAVTGLSGGGWQTIFLSALDPRVTLSDPVAGYSGDRTRVRHFKDLGDSEQTPCDMATVGDYTHLTAMRAPRPTLLTFNDKDDCCFESGYALPPLLDAARPIFRLYGKEDALRTHVNSDPGTHNYEKDNRQAFYRMVGDFFYPGDRSYSAAEIPCAKEVKSKDQLNVPLPQPNADFHSLALALSKKLPHAPNLPGERDAALRWQKVRRDKLRALVRARDFTTQAEKAGSEEKGGVRATFWRLRLHGGGADQWTIPVVELVQGEPKGTAVLVADGGRAGAAAEVERLLKAGQRVWAVDPWYFGESKIETKDWLFALLVATVGDRPLGLEASEVAAVARWAREQGKAGPVALVAVG